MVYIYIDPNSYIYIAYFGPFTPMAPNSLHRGVKFYIFAPLRCKIGPKIKPSLTLTFGGKIAKIVDKIDLGDGMEVCEATGIDRDTARRWFDTIPITPKMSNL